MPKDVRGQNDRIGFRITRRLKERLEDMADEKHMHVSELAREILTKAVLYREKQLEREAQNNE